MRTRKVFIFLQLVILFFLFIPSVSASTESGTIITGSAVGIDSESAIVQGSANPRGQFTKVWFEWGKESKLNQTTISQVITDSNFVKFRASLVDLDSDTIYSYRAVARNANGIWYGETKRFTTEDSKAAFRKSHRPDVYTETATATGYNRSNVRGMIKLEGSNDPRRDPQTEGWFEWGEDIQSLSKRTSRQLIGGDGYVIKFSDTLIELKPSTTYYYRAVAKNRADTSYGEVMSITTEGNPLASEPYPPGGQTVSSGLMTSRTAVLKGRINPNGATTAAWFEWGENPIAPERRTPTQPVGAGNQFVDISANLDNLNSDTTYYYRIVSVNSLGEVRGSIEKLETSATEMSGVTSPLKTSAEGSALVSFSPYQTIVGALKKKINVILGRNNLETKKSRTLTASAVDNLKGIPGSAISELIAILILTFLGYRSFIVFVSGRRERNASSPSSPTLLSPQPPVPTKPSEQTGGSRISMYPVPPLPPVLTVPPRPSGEPLPPPRPPEPPPFG